MTDNYRACVDCGHAFELAGDHLQWFTDQGMRTPHRCKPCRRKRRDEGRGDRSPIREKRVCLVCLQLFVITEQEAAWFEAQEWSLPKRCSACRKAIRDGVASLTSVA